jgi:hypothetical protein
MTITIPPELEADFTTIAQTKGMSPEEYLRQLLEREVQSKRVSQKPLKSLYGVLAKYGPAPSAEEIDENRKEMFQNFARDHDEW